MDTHIVCDHLTVVGGKSGSTLRGERLITDDLHIAVDAQNFVVGGELSAILDGELAALVNRK